MCAGQSGLRKVWKDREELVPSFIDQLAALSSEYGERLLRCPLNSISYAVSLSRPPPPLSQSPTSTVPVDSGSGPARDVVTHDRTDEVSHVLAAFDLNTPAVPVSGAGGGGRGGVGNSEEEARALTFFGSQLYHRSVSGVRVVAVGQQVTVISGYTFRNWGAHHDDYPCAYFTAACAVGLTSNEVALFFTRLRRVFRDFKSSDRRHRSGHDNTTEPVPPSQETVDDDPSDVGRLVGRTTSGLSGREWEVGMV